MTLPTVFWHDDPSSQRLKEAIGTLAQALGMPLRIIPGYLVLVETPAALCAARAAPQLFVAQASTVSAETPPAAARACEICGAPVSGRWKVCASPACQQERKRRYAAKYRHAQSAGVLSTVSAETPPARTTAETPYLTTVSAETPLALAAETEVGARPAPFELDWPLAACCRVESGELAGQHLMAWELRQRLADRSLPVGTTLLLRSGKRAQVALAAPSGANARALTPAG